MFRRKHALFKAFHRVARLDPDFSRPENLAGVQLFRDQVHRTTAHRIAGGDCPRMCVEPAIFRQQGRVDVYDPAMPFGGKPGREYTHEAGERDRSDFVVVEHLAQRPVEFLSLDTLAVPSPGWEPC